MQVTKVLKLERTFLPKQLEVLNELRNPETKFILYSGAFR